jgi:hypothetical protein
MKQNIRALAAMAALLILSLTTLGGAQQTPTQQTPTYQGSYPGQTVGTSNGATLLKSWATGEATNAVTTSPSAITLYGGTPPGSPIFVLVTNDGANDAYVATFSGGHTFRIPAGSSEPIYTGATPLYAMTETGTTTLYCTEAAY